MKKSHDLLSLIACVCLANSASSCDTLLDLLMGECVFGGLWFFGGFFLCFRVAQSAVNF